jgi:hypothetical protein
MHMRKSRGQTRPSRKKAAEADGKTDYMFTFGHPDVKCTMDSHTYSEQDREDVRGYLASATREICIDKTYVDFKGTKYKKTFMSEEGWDRLCEFIKQTGGKNLTKTQRAELLDTYRVMIACYLYQLLQDLGYDERGMYIEVGKRFSVKVEEDTIREWERYPGDWRTWDPSMWDGGLQ